MSTVKELLKKKHVRLLCLAFSGIVTGLTVCFSSIGLLEWVSMIPAFAALLSICDDEGRRLRSLYLYGLFYFTLYFAVCWHWFFAMYPMSYTGISKPAAFSVLLAAVIGLPLIQSVAYAFVFLIFGYISKTKLISRTRILLPFVAAALFTVFEWFQTLFWFGVPWGRLAIGQTSALVTLQSASVFGGYFVSFLLVFINFLFAYAIYNVKLAKLAVSVAVSLFCANTLFGILYMSSDSLRKSDECVNVAAIQGNISSAEKWDELFWFDDTSDVYSELTREAARNGAEIVVWPETVLPVFFEDSLRCQKLVSDLAVECDIVLMLGTVSHGDDNGQYNTVITVLPDGSFSESTYSKQHLVPFGEYMPYRKLISAVIPALGDMNMLSADFTAGEESTVVNTGKAIVGSVICFDSIYENTVRKSVKNGAELIAIETNDSWFFDSAASRMHKGQAVIRSVENGRFTVRSANTGISAIISPNGVILSEKEALEEGYCLSSVELRDNMTVYTLIGNVFVALCAGLVIFAFAFDVSDKIKIKKGDKTEND